MVSEASLNKIRVIQNYNAVTISLQKKGIWRRIKSDVKLQQLIGILTIPKNLYVKILIYTVWPHK